MRRFGKISLSSAPFYASLLVTFVMAAFFGLFWTINEYQAYQESIENIHQNYQSQYQDRVKEELGKVIDFITYKRTQDYMQAEDEIREKVQSAYTIASHIYRLHKDEEDLESLRSMVVEVLRPIRWNNGKGYYYAGSIHDGRMDLFADEPYFEGQDLRSYTDSKGNIVFKDIMPLIRDKGAGVYRYNLEKPAFPGKIFSSFSFVKYFEPFDWFIGASIYIDDMEERLQEETLTRIKSMRFSQDGTVFGFRYDGTIISYHDDQVIGRSVRTLIDTEGFAYGNTMLEAGLGKQRQDFISYTTKNPDTDKGKPRLSYVKAYPDWQWILGTSMSMDAMEKAISDETTTYQTISFRNVFTFIILFIIAVGFLLLSAFIYSMKIRQGLNLFTDFFRKAADLNTSINNDNLIFTEFEDLGTLANQMVDDRIQKERILKRNELRLDTLLSLGMMDKYSIQEKYDFVLHRIVQISESAVGYLALVNGNQSHFSLCSYVEDRAEDLARKRLFTELTRSVNDGGLPALAVLNKKPLLCNSCDDSLHDSYPYTQDLARHLDIPILNNGRVVLIAGVCNSRSDYSSADIRQITMLLEGMWLHVLKTCSEKEMARLERQIIAVGEEERNNIGRDLHDDLGSHLSGVDLLSKALEQKLEKEAPVRAGQLGVIRDLIRDAIEKTRRLSRGLYPVHVVEQGLEAALEELVTEIKSLFSVHCTLSFDNQSEWNDVHMAPHIYYIIREAVFNAARHGKPTTITLSIQATSNRGSIRILDDGIGFDQAANRKGLGFYTMKYRAKAIGANLTIVSKQGGGTVVTLFWEGME